MRQFPRWLSVLLGLVTLGLGLFIIFRPFASLSVLILVAGIAMILTGVSTLAAGKERSTWTWLAGLGWIVGGILVLSWPDLSIFGVALVVGIAMIVGGLTEVLAGFRGTTDQRLAAVIGGSASAVFGVLALSWPDVTVLVVAVVFGAGTILFGVRTVVDALRGADVDADREPERRGWFRRAGRLAWVILGLVVALTLAGLSTKLNRSVSAVDAFYTAPAEVPGDPGELLRSEGFTTNIPDGAEAWRILYTTTRSEGIPAVASALVIVPSDQGSDPLPVVAWAHGTTGVDRACAPSVMPSGLAAGAFFSLDRVLEQGWAFVATDYIGLGTEGPHPYLIGQGEARSVLDAVRAAKQMPEVSLADRTVVWGHSQGGGAALWTGQLAPSYAPDANVIGVAALAPASDLVGLVQNLGNVQGGSIFATYVMSAYADTYDDVRLDDYVEPTARVQFQETAQRCLDSTAIVSALGSVATGMSIFSQDLATGAFAERLEENSPTGPIAAPLLLAQGEADSLVIPTAQAAFVDRLCDSGQAVDYRTYPGLDHVPLVEADSPLIPQLIAWTQDRFAGEPATNTCP